ncbi:MAG: Coenzyme F420 hydrogenase/dehydrogenase, beta subunit C-terminal domain [Candidatus Methanofastidiosa archaeon]|nr:Coenzyme F420 hydrogenase/dehydrogenase, beta subunit C-terminal domain [Candidatus Methanofastidiosa archaeon]
MRNYKELKEEVWDKGICSGCSICTIVCPMKTIFFDHGSPTTYNYCKSEKDNVPCGGCYSCCPRIETFLEKHGIGSFIGAFAAKASMDISKKQSGGAVTAILFNALKRNLIDSVVMVGQDHTTMKTYSIAVKDADQLLCYAGSKYIWYTPSLTALRDIIEEGTSKRIAIVGTPCVCQAVRKMLKSDNPVLNKFKESVLLLIGVFCTEIFDYDRSMRYLSENDIIPSEIKRVDIKKDLIIEKYDGSIIELPITKDLKKTGCEVCMDFSAVDADISAGSIGSEEGYTTILTRTPMGEFFLNSAKENGCIEADALVSTDIIEKFASQKYKRNYKRYKEIIGDGT